MNTTDVRASIAIRDDPGSDGRTIFGVAVPYGIPVTGTTREYGDAVETFQRGAFADHIAAGRRGAVLDRHEGTVVGVLTELEEADAGLEYTGRLFDSQAARDYAERVNGGMRDVSLEFVPGKVSKRGRTVTHTGGVRLAAIAGSYVPAYEGASAALRDEEESRVTDQATAPAELEAEVPAPAGMTEEGTRAIASAIARTESDRAMRSIRELLEAGGSGQASPYAAYRTLGELFAATRDTPTLADWPRVALAHRVAADQITTNNPGVMTPGVSGTVHGIVDLGRAAIAAFGTAPLGDGGMNVLYPYYDGDLTGLVGAQATQKTEVVSGRVDLKLGSQPILTYAGYSDIALQLIRRSSPAYIEAWLRIMLAAWAKVTEAAFVARLQAVGTGASFVAVDFATATPDVVRAGVFAGSVIVKKTTGSPAAFVLAGETAFLKIAAALYPAPVFNQSGTARADTLAVEVSGLGVEFSPALPTAQAIVSNGQAASWHEEGPFQLTELDVPRLGEDRADLVDGRGRGLRAEGARRPTGDGAGGPPGGRGGRGELEQEEQVADMAPGAWIDADELLAAVGVDPGSASDDNRTWAELTSAGINTGMLRSLDRTVDDPILVTGEADLKLAAFAAGRNAYKRRETAFDTAGYADLDGAVVRVARDAIQTVEPMLDRWRSLAAG